MEKQHFKRQPMAETRKAPRSFQEIILRLQAYWGAQGLSLIPI